MTRRPVSVTVTKPRVRTKATAATADRSPAKAEPKPKLARKPPMPSPGHVAALFRRFHQALPEPKGELEHENAYQLLVAVVLSAQATDAGVNRATRPLFARVKTPEQMVALGEAGLTEHIKSIGLFRNKAKNVIALSKALIEEHGGQVPQDRDALEKLAGVGRKTANVVMNVAFGAPTMAVDTHVFRVSHRLGLSAGKTPEAVEADLMRLVPPEHGVPAHHWLILHGRYTCKARTPECWRCLVADLCPVPDKTPAPK